MHAGGANTVLRNNRKLLKKRSSRFKSKRTVMGLKEEDIIRKDEHGRRLTTMSASEIRKIGRKLRRRRRTETFVLLLIILATLIFIFSSFEKVEELDQPVVVKVDKPQTPEIVEVRTMADNYVILGREFFYKGDYERARTMFVKASEHDPEHCKAKDWLINTDSRLSHINKKKLKENGETRYKEHYTGY